MGSSRVFVGILLSLCAFMPAQQDRAARSAGAGLERPAVPAVVPPAAPPGTSLERPPAAPIPGQRFLPRDLVTVAVLRADSQQMAALSNNTLRSIFANRRGADEDPLSDIARRLRLAMDLDEAAMLECLKGGITWALLQDQDSYLAIVECGARGEDVRAGLAAMRERAANGSGGVRSEVVDGVEIFEVRTTAARLHAHAIADGHALFANDARTIEEAIRRARAKDPKTQNTQPMLQDLARWIAEDQPVFALAARDQPGQKSVIDRVCPDEASARMLLHLARTEGLGTTGLTIVLRKEDVLVRHRLATTPPRSDLMARMFDQEVQTKATGSVVPKSAIAFAIANTPAGEVVRAAIAAITALPAEGLARTLWQDATVNAASGPLADLLNSLGDRVTLIALAPTQGDVPDLALIIDAPADAVARTAIDQLMLPHAARISSQRIGAHQVHHLMDTARFIGITPALTMAHRRLIVATNEAAIRTILQHLDAPDIHPEAASVAAAIDRTTRASWWIAKGQPSRVARRFEDWIGSPDARRFGTASSRILHQADLPRRGRLRVDRLGLSFDVYSPAGDPDTIGLLAGLSARMLEAIGVEAIVASRAPQEWHEITATIAAAQKALKRARTIDRDKHGRAEYGDLDDLLLAGLPPELLGTPLGDGVYERQGHLLTMLLPEAIDGREHDFFFVAWPARSATGRVHGADQGRDALFNDLLAGSAGIRRMTVQDVFQGGRFGGAMGPGWREVQSLVRQQQDPQGETQMTVEDIALYELILAAEKAGTDRVDRAVVQALKTVNPIVAARAAHALGLLKVVEAVPLLVEVARIHGDLEVRRHAMRALCAIRDPRSIKLSQDLLHADDVVVRALAAKNLGGLKAKQAVESLLDMMAARREETDRQDTVQALLALADIGDPAALHSAPSAAIGTDKAVAESLAYLMSSLSPKLPRDQEIRFLIGILDHTADLARRYAIQRLGELEAKEAVVALENRIAKEDRVLRPLVEVSLSAIRRDQANPQGEGLWPRIQGGAERIAQTFIDRWNAMTGQRRMIAGGIGIAPLLLILMMLGLQRRRRRKAAAESWVRLVSPSEQVHDTDSYDEGDTDYDADYADAEAAPEEQAPPSRLPGSTSRAQGRMRR